MRNGLSEPFDISCALRYNELWKFHILCNGQQHAGQMNAGVCHSEERSGACPERSRREESRFRKAQEPALHREKLELVQVWMDLAEEKLQFGVLKVEGR